MKSVSPNDWVAKDADEILELGNDESLKKDDKSETMPPGNSYNQLLKEFASETSFGGISKATLSHGNIRRFVWLLISVICYCFAIMYCFLMVKTFFEKPTKTTVDITHTQNIEFPSVTVCNLNQFRDSKVHEIENIQDVLKSFSSERRNKSDGSEFEGALEKLRKVLRKGLGRSYDDEDEDDGDEYLDDVEVDEDFLLEQHVAILASFHNTTQLKRVGHQFDDMILDCSWKGVNCRTGYFSKFWVNHWNWKYGNCFTFNPGGNETGSKLDIFKTSKTGFHHGLRLDINIEQSGEYVDELSNEAGALITVHRARQMPFPYDDGITVSPGFSSSIAIRKDSVTRVDPHGNGSCYSSETLPETNIYRAFMGGSCAKYSFKACMQSCLARGQYKRCGCAEARYAGFVAKICHSLQELECSQRVSSDFKHDELGCKNNCPVPCTQESFLHSIMTSKLTSKEREARKKKDFGDNNMTSFIFEDNFLRVKVYYDELNLQTIEESTYYGVNSLISDIGGQLGLWVGVSIISVAEFGELLVNLCIVAMRKYQDRRKKTTAVTELQ